MRLPEPGELFADRYRIDRLLGEGGFGRVVAATDERNGRIVAIKILKPADDDGAVTRARRFLREIQAIAQLEHPNTLTLLDHGRTSDGLLYMVSELVPGTDLSEPLAAGQRFSEADVVRVVLQILESLREAHTAGILHRDIKPDNVRLFEYMGDPLRVKVLDFGIAKSLSEEQANLTATGHAIGTPRYMSPDQLYGWELTPASDLYSVGLIAYEMLLGKAARSADTPFAQLRDGSGVSTGLAAVVNRLLAPQPEDRFQSAQEAIDALRAPQPIALPAPEPARPPRTTTHAPLAPPAAADPNARRIVAALVVFAAVVAIGSALFLSSRQTENVAPAPARRASVGIVQPSPAAQAEHDAEPSAAAAAIEIAPPGVTGCGRAPKFTGRGSLSRMVGLARYTADAFIPKDYDPNRPHPVVVLVSWTEQSAKLLDQHGGFDALAQQHQFIVVAPSHPRGERQLRQMRLGQLGPNVEEWVEHVEDHVAWLDEQLCIDPNRVHLVELGITPQLANAFRCRPWVSAAAWIGPDGPSLTGSTTIMCDSRPVPFLSMTFDRHLLRRGSPPRPTPELRSWLKNNACNDEARLLMGHDRGQCFAFDCAAPTRVCEARRARTGEQWEPPWFPMLDLIWDFFESSTSPSVPAPDAGQLH